MTCLLPGLVKDALANYGRDYLSQVIGGLVFLGAQDDVIAWVDMHTPLSGDFCKSAADIDLPGWNDCLASLFETPAQKHDEHIEDDVLPKIKTHEMNLTAWVAAINAHPEIPVFVYSGAEDGFVPPETFADEVKALGGKIHYTNFPNSGHEGFLNEPQVWTELFNDGTVL